MKNTIKKIIGILLASSLVFGAVYVGAKQLTKDDVMYKLSTEQVFFKMDPAKTELKGGDGTDVISFNRDYKNYIIKDSGNGFSILNKKNNKELYVESFEVFSFGNKSFLYTTVKNVLVDLTDPGVPEKQFARFSAGGDILEIDDDTTEEDAVNSINFDDTQCYYDEEEEEWMGPCND